MPSILLQQFKNLTDFEIQEKISIVENQINKYLNITEIDDSENPISYIDTLNLLRKKYTKILTVLNELNKSDLITNDLSDDILNKVVFLAQKYAINPQDFGETFESLGVTQPWVFKNDTSVIDTEFQDLKEKMKTVGIQYIKENPACTETDILNYFDANYSAKEASVAKFLLYNYMDNCYKYGFITSDDFSSLRDFIVNTPIETLLEI